MDLHGAFHVYDTTLRDGAQQEGLNLSVADKLTIARQLDGLGVGYIEGGWPGANPKDTEFFRRAAAELDLQAREARGLRRHPPGRRRAADDPLVAALRDSGASVVTLVAKSHDRHVELALRTTLEENLAMVRDTVSHLRAEGQQVFLDAEHFFDGYRANRDYALEVLRTAYEAGAEVVALCDTNGGMLPGWVADVVHDVIETTGVRVGIHCHNDTGCAVANTLAAVDAGATHVQGTHQRVRRAHRQRRPRLGRRQPRAQAGPRGAARPGCCTRPPGSRTRSPRSPTSRRPRASRTSASRRSRTRPACTPARSRSTRTSTSTWTRCGVGNDMRLLVSDMAGRASIELKGRELGFDLAPATGAGHPGHRPGQGAGVDRATPSRPPTRRSSCCCRGGRGRPAVVLRGRVVAGDHRDARPRGRRRGGLRGDREAAAEGVRYVVTGEGNGPVNALDQALRDGDRAGLPGGREVRADRLQGPHPRPGPRHRRDHPGADRDQRRRVVVGHRRRRRTT